MTRFYNSHLRRHRRGVRETRVMKQGLIRVSVLHVFLHPFDFERPKDRSGGPFPGDP